MKASLLLHHRRGIEIDNNYFEYIWWSSDNSRPNGSGDDDGRYADQRAVAGLQHFGQEDAETSRTGCSGGGERAEKVQRLRRRTGMREAGHKLPRPAAVGQLGRAGRLLASTQQSQSQAKSDGSHSQTMLIDAGFLHAGASAGLCRSHHNHAVAFLRHSSPSELPAV